MCNFLLAMAMHFQEIIALPLQVQMTCEVNGMSQNNSFIFTCYVKTVPAYNFKLIWVEPGLRDAICLTKSLLCSRQVTV